MERLHRWIHDPFHPVTGRHSGAAKVFSVFMAFSFISYLILTALRRASEGDHYTAANDWIWVYLGYALLCGVVMLVAPALRMREVRERGAERPKPSLRDRLWSAVVATSQGFLCLTFFVATLGGVHALDEMACKIGPETYSKTGVTMADRVLDTASVLSCAVSPSRKCKVLLKADFVPYRTWMATRACKSRVRGTHPVCKIALEEGSMPESEICDLDARAPYYERVCPGSARRTYRPDIGFRIHRETEL